jgi:hypothetical protein
MKDYSKRIQNLRNRRQDTISKAFSVSESFNRNQYGESISYALESMEQIDPQYTTNTYKACERVQVHIKDGLREAGIQVDFRYQGSVPTNTHIKNYSDIDLLTIHEGFVTLQPPQKPDYPYQGNPVNDLKTMRIKIYRILDSVYTAVTIDDTGSKALKISGGSLAREIDIISCNWYDSVKYSETNDEDYRGVNILDRDKNIRIVNYPFMHIYWINEKDAKVAGNEKRLIRLLKTVRSDSDQEIKLSSYDIASLVFRMDDSLLQLPHRHRLELLERCDVYLTKVISDSVLRDSLYVANGTRKIFSDDGAKLSEVIKLKKELRELIDDIGITIRPLYETIQKAEVNY